MSITIHPSELEFSAVRAQGPGGQNVNKVSNAVHLRFDIRRSALPDEIKDRLLALNDQRITKEGVIIIKAQSSRSLEQNKVDAVSRLEDLIRQATQVRARRRPTRPTLASKQRRLRGKTLRGELKLARGKLSP